MFLCKVKTNNKMNKFTKAIAAIMLIVAAIVVAGCNKPDEPNNGGNNNSQNDSIIDPNNGGGDVPVVPVIPEGAVKGRFTINSTGKQVYFSKGNLQYRYSNRTWRFALNQWDYLGRDNETNFATLNDWIDLFGWGTSGWNNGNTYYYPFDFYNGSMEEGFGYGPTNGISYDFNLSGVNGYADWGVYNQISNGGSQAGLWRTLSKQEWQYLFFNRHTNSEAHFAFSKVNGVNGIILFPDDWDASLYSINDINTIGSYSNNIISISSWRLLEDQGAAFLPAAGYRSILTVHESDHSGHYWSVTNAEDTSWGGAYSLWFYGASSANPDPNLYIDHGEARCNGLSVRLVCDVE